MTLGLKRGTVQLADHDPKWKNVAAETMHQLKRILGSVAKDVQHIGSTAIVGIKAKPIIDIAVAADDFAEIEKFVPALHAGGFLRRNWPDDTQLLFAVGEDSGRDDRISTHFIHIVKTNSEDWHNYINFRDYLNAMPHAAKEYENIKICLAEENPIDEGRAKYLAGKNDFIVSKIDEARIWVEFDREFVDIQPITKGWSEDKKYCVTNSGGTKYLLRITPMARYEARKSLFEMLKQVAELDIPMCVPVDFGTCGDGVYLLQTWIDGEDLENVLPALSDTQQYVLGFESGQILRKMHSIPAPKTQEGWAIRFNRKTDEKIEKYEKCSLRFDGDKHVIAYIEENRHLLNNRPQCFQHGDYHVGNMMVENGELKIIDFDRYDFGDSWEEFNRIVWCVAASPHFATGQLYGYFDGEPPIEFFKLLAFYISSNTLSSIYWAIPFGQSEIDTMMKQSQDVLAWFDNMQNPVPSWYLKDFHVQWADGIPYKLKAPFDFSFLSKYGKVFKIFDDQDSGNICFGMQNDSGKYFIKFAGAPTQRANVSPPEAIERMKAAVPIYRDLAHPALANLITAEEIGGGYIMVFDWTDAECMGIQYPQSRGKFMQMPTATRLRVLDDILDFHAHLARQGYVAIDFYDGCIMYDFAANRTILCDIEFYEKMPYLNKMGRMWGSGRFMSPEEFTLGAAIDEVTNVYAMGATAFEFFGDNHDRCMEKWSISKELFDVAKKATSDERGKRQQSIAQFITEWKAGMQCSAT